MTHNQVMKLDKAALLNGFSPLRYVYFGRTEGTNKHNGVTSIGYSISDDGLTLRVAVAFCSKDDAFSKKRTQDIIYGRLAQGRFVDIVTPADEKPFIEMRYEEIIDVIKTIVNDEFKQQITTGTDVVYDSVQAFVLGNSYKVFPTFATVKLPWWFSGI